MAKWWESNYPWLLSAVATFFAWRYGFDPSTKGSLPGYVMTIVTVAVGFLAAIATILLTIRSRAIQFMKRVGKFKSVLDFIWIAVRVSSLFLVVSLPVSLLPAQGYPVYRAVLSLAWSFLGAASLLTIFRAMDISLGLLTGAAGDMENQS